MRIATYTAGDAIQEGLARTNATGIQLWTPADLVARSEASEAIRLCCRKEVSSGALATPGDTGAEYPPRNLVVEVILLAHRHNWPTQQPRPRASSC